jgi:hypothetical protein
LLGLLLLALLPISRGEACSCMQLSGSVAEQVAQSQDRAQTVFVARLLRSTLGPDRQHRNLVVENAQFKVMQVFKGALREGQIIDVRQVVSAGSCGQSSTNNPPWMLAQEKPGEPPKPVKVSREWLIYAYGPEPYELSRCSRSAPLNAGGGEDVKLLRALAKRETAPARDSGKH